MINSDELIGTTNYLTIGDVSCKPMSLKLGLTVYRECLRRNAEGNIYV